MTSIELNQNVISKRIRCNEPGCPNLKHARGFCKSCYRRHFGRKIPGELKTRREGRLPVLCANARCPRNGRPFLLPLRYINNRNFCSIACSNIVIKTAHNSSEKTLSAIREFLEKQVLRVYRYQRELHETYLAAVRAGDRAAIATAELTRLGIIKWPDDVKTFSHARTANMFNVSPKLVSEISKTLDHDLLRRQADELEAKVD